MANITKAELVDQVAAQAGTDKTTASAVLKAFEETVLASVTKGDKIALTGFVSFEQVSKKATTARNPRTGEEVPVKAKKAPKATLGATFKKTVNKAQAQGAQAFRENVDKSLAGLTEREVSHLNTLEMADPPLVDRDPARRLFVGGRELFGGDERPEERVDGARTTFTFASDHGLVTVDGNVLEEGSAFDREGNVITFVRAPARNASLRQHPDYLVSDPAMGTVTLAEPPEPGEPVWARSYTYYSRPLCGETAFECFMSMPQHPVPFPNWIAERLEDGPDNDNNRYALAEAINKDFGSFDKFREEFSTAAATQFGSGWAWLVKGADGKLKVVKTGNADCPLRNGDTPILTIDVWEHAYYIDYRNARPKYIETFLSSLVNWDFVAKNFG